MLGLVQHVACLKAATFSLTHAQPACLVRLEPSTRGTLLQATCCRVACWTRLECSGMLSVHLPPVWQWVTSSTVPQQDAQIIMVTRARSLLHASKSTLSGCSRSWPP